MADRLRSLMGKGTMYKSLHGTVLADISIDDAVALGEEDLKELVLTDKPEHAARGLAFIKLVIRPLRERRPPQKRVESDEEERVIFNPLIPFLVNGEVCSFAYRHVASVRVTPISGQIGIRDLKIALKSLPEVKVLDLSSCYLEDEDLPFIEEAILDTSITMLDLSDNRFHGVAFAREQFDKSLLAILRRSVYVNIMQNPAATIDRRDFFLSQGELLRHLVWIPQSVLHRKDMWESFVTETTLPYVLEAHAKYFATLFYDEYRKMVHGIPSHEVSTRKPHVLMDVNRALEMLESDECRFCTARACLERFPDELLSVLNGLK